MTVLQFFILTAYYFSRVKIYIVSDLHILLIL